MCDKYIQTVRNTQRGMQPRSGLNGVEIQSTKRESIVQQKFHIVRYLFLNVSNRIYVKWQIMVSGYEELQQCRNVRKLYSSVSTSPAQIRISVSGGIWTSSCFPCVSENAKILKPLYRIIISAVLFYFSIDIRSQNCPGCNGWIARHIFSSHTSAQTLRCAWFRCE